MNIILKAMLNFKGIPVNAEFNLQYHNKQHIRRQCDRKQQQ